MKLLQVDVFNVYLDSEKVLIILKEAVWSTLSMLFPLFKFHELDPNVGRSTSPVEKQIGTILDGTAASLVSCFVTDNIKLRLGSIYDLLAYQPWSSEGKSTEHTSD